uniref:Uncharacterized protein n=1 Tax=Meloidogyne floridensis TaxID=298350 RepID=A0A915P4C5_9BILA
MLNLKILLFLNFFLLIFQHSFCIIQRDQRLLIESKQSVFRLDPCNEQAWTNEYNTNNAIIGENGKKQMTIERNYSDYYTDGILICGLNDHYKNQNEIDFLTQLREGIIIYVLDYYEDLNDYIKLEKVEEFDDDDYDIGNYTSLKPFFKEDFKFVEEE